MVGAGPLGMPELSNLSTKLPKLYVMSTDELLGEPDCLLVVFAQKFDAILDTVI
jgi:hypothetical protein